MGIKGTLAKPVAKLTVKAIEKWAYKPGKYQQKTFAHLIKKGAKTRFGKDHHFDKINSYADFKKNVPIRSYEDFKPYIDSILQGEQDVLWPGKPDYMAKTSGTTSGTKYIPITKDSMPNHISGARNALLCYIHETGKSEFLDGKLIFLSGSPTLTEKNGIKIGRLSGLVNHHVPDYLKTNQLPSYETNCIEEWEKKVDTIVEETSDQDMRLISGIPPWVQMYFDKLIEKTGKPIKDIFPHFNLYIYGGVNFEPYKSKLFQSIGKEIDTIETFPASEGFIAFQNSQYDKSLLLLLNSGIFFEFVPMEEFFNENPTRLTIDDVELNKNYAIIINNNAGLWGYSLGDTIKFTSKNPCKIVFTGRVKHYISAFGEHVISEEVEKALQKACEKHPETGITEFTVAPQVTPADDKLPYHEWFIEFSAMPADFESFSYTLDESLVQLNPYYDDLISGNILQRLKITPIRKNGFIDYMRNKGKLGGQNKVPRLSNDRKLADELNPYVDERA